jgi:hypothetical protein
VLVTMHPLAHCMACMTLKGSMYAYDDVDDVVLPVEDHKTGNGSFSSIASLRMQVPIIKRWSCGLPIFRCVRMVSNERR